MQIVIVAATEMEIEALQKMPIQTRHSINYSIHGIGMMMATYHLQKIADNKPDLIIQCGIAGCYSDEIQIGETVIVHAEILGDTGAEDHDEYLDLIDLKLMEKDQFPFSHGALMNQDAMQYSSLRKVTSITVNSAAGNERTIALRHQKFGADIESMEGACLHYVCLMNQIPFMQFRGISNKVEPRNKDRWRIKEAIANCHLEAIKFIQQISE